MSSYPGQLYKANDQVFRTPSHQPPLVERTYTPGYPHSPSNSINNNHLPPYPTTPPARERAHGQSHYFERAPPLPPKPPQLVGPNTGYPQSQYFPATGKRKALLIGINYFGTSRPLEGCINDVRKIAPFLNQRYGFSYDDMVILTDDQRDPISRPTRANIIRAMHWLVANAQPNDSFFFHFSGHGDQTLDLDGDEEDGFDETILPEDFKQAGMIVDDEMHDILVKPLPAGCRLTAIFDCCHSGSALDLPYNYSVDGQEKEPCLVHDTATSLLHAGVSYARGDVKGLINTGVSLFFKATRGKKAREKSRRTKSSPAIVIQLSGCKDYETAKDTVANGQATGAMSWAFREVLTKNPNQTYASLLQNLRALLQIKYSQKPVLSSSHLIDTNSRFIV